MIIDLIIIFGYLVRLSEIPSRSMYHGNSLATDLYTIHEFWFGGRLYLIKYTLIPWLSVSHILEVGK
jgi:signal peptidase I